MNNKTFICVIVYVPHVAYLVCVEGKSGPGVFRNASGCDDSYFSMFSNI